MIYEFATLFSFFCLILIFIINTYQFSLLKEINDSNEGITVFKKKINTIRILIIIFLILLLLAKVFILLSGPDTILSTNTFSKTEVLILFVNFFYAVLWLMIVFFVFQSYEIRTEFLLEYLKKISITISIVFILDFVLEGIVYLTSISDYLNLSVIKETRQVVPYPTDLFYIITLIIILTITLSVFFISFLLKRHIRLLRYIELFTLFLLLAVGYLMFFGTGPIIGWSESLDYLLILFSFKYGYTGYIFFIILAVTLISNASVILLFSIKSFFNSEQQIKNKIVNLVKVGFVSTIILSCMAIWPHLYLWFY